MQSMSTQNGSRSSEREPKTPSERLRDALSDVRGEPYVTHRYSESALRSACRRSQSKLDKTPEERNFANN